jgi:hypothetical protein
MRYQGLKEQEATETAESRRAGSVFSVFSVFNDLPVHPLFTQAEVKTVEAVLPIHKAQLLSYMKPLDIPLGLIINFNSPKLTDGISRLILPGANLD